MLDYSYNPALVLASLAIVLMSGFTGLSLTQGASRLGLARRKLVVAMSAVALGGGIWSMHFVAMLGLRLPILFYYDALTTLISALVAVLMTGCALLIVHFGDRTPLRITLAGGILGLGVPAMHYIGMSGMQMCRPVYSAAGVALALACSLALCIVSFRLCYGQRRARNIILGTLGFGLAVFSVHFIAMGGTRFAPVPGDVPSPLGMSNEVLAFGVTLASFVIAGAFLLTGVTFRADAPAADPVPVSAPPEPETPSRAPGDSAAIRVPYEKDGRIHFAATTDIAAIRAEGRYTYLYCRSGRMFSPWSISEADRRLEGQGFHRCHRSYVVNADFVSSFERKKDTGVLYFDGVTSLDKAPVSRSHLADIRKSLGV
ncbi:MHYT domain-containing protein [Sedimentitalea sp. JM2-8]|uniref:MHYT domain-containing protein n=1 Tax=Sedimentitalea xiamensis TaxID=3050037 RepID=A0ABT7FEM9_9RHOB|nr:MHYT domain-containing protein [Sedimentitalea xiamensis]MDK3073515.1 MHYT domain-containing protein [Sedimentitalea xiamensis]